MTSIITTFTTIRRSPYQSILVTIIIALIAFVAYSISLVTLSAQALLNYIQTKPQVIAFFKLKTPEDTIFRIENEFRQSQDVKTVSVITQNEALDIYREENANEPLLLELVTADILPASIEIQANDIEKLITIKDKLSQEESVEEVVFQQEMIDQIQIYSKAVKNWGLVFLTVLGATAFLTTSVIIALKASNQRNKINILRLLGASKSFVKAPFVFEGMFYGLCGSFLGWIACFALLMFAWPNLVEQVKSFIPTLIIPSILLYQFLIGSAISLLLGASAGFFAITRLIKK